MGMGREKRSNPNSLETEDLWAGLVCLVNALVLCYVLAQGANTTFFLANSEFQFFIEAMDTIQFLARNSSSRRVVTCARLPRMFSTSAERRAYSGHLTIRVYCRNSDIW
jgi:hypothetical protein